MPAVLAPRICRKEPGREHAVGAEKSLREVVVEHAAQRHRVGDPVRAVHQKVDGNEDARDGARPHDVAEWVHGPSKGIEHGVDVHTHLQHVVDERAR
eukprot:5869820-Prymnesium_polylepis.1